MQNVPRYHYNDYLQWKEDWELIDGYPYTMLPSPSIAHQKMAGKFFYLLQTNLLKNNDCNCIVLYETDWKIDNFTVVRPDVMIICESKNEETHPTSTPRLIIEIFSPSTKQRDRLEKFAIYQANGVPYYIMADPDNNTLEYFMLKDNQYKSIDHLEVFNLTSECSIDNEMPLVFDENYKFGL